MKYVIPIVLLLFFSGCSLRSDYTRSDLDNLSDTAAKQTISSGSGVYWQNEVTKFNSMFGEVYGKFISTITLDGTDLVITFADATTKTVDLSSLDTGSGGGYTNLTEFLTQTPWRWFYSDGSGDVKEMVFGAAGTYIKSNGTAAAPTWANPTVADEELQDVVGAMVTGNTETNITVSYNDTTGKLDFTVTGGSMVYPSAGSFGYTNNGSSWTDVTLDTDASDVSTADDSVFSAKAVDTVFAKKANALTMSPDISEFIASDTYAEALAYLNLEIGTDVQAFNVNLSGWANISPTAGNIATSGTISGSLVIGTDADAHTFTSAEYHGGAVIASGAGVYTLPSVAAGYSTCVYAGQGVEVSIQLLPAAGDYLVVDGVRGNEATSLKSSADLGDAICVFGSGTADWIVTKLVGAWAE